MLTLANLGVFGDNKFTYMTILFIQIPPLVAHQAATEHNCTFVFKHMIFNYTDAETLHGPFNTLNV